MSQSGEREQDYEAMQGELRSKPGVIETLELWKLTKKHLPSDDSELIEDTLENYKRGVNDLFVQPR